MKIVVTADGYESSSPTNPRFGRCPVFVFVETETMAFEAAPNPAVSASGGAGIQAAQFVVEQGVGAVLSGNLGPNAADVFQAANVPVYFNKESTVKAAVEAFKLGQLPLATEANVPAHAGMGMRRGRGQGRSVPPPVSREKKIATLKQEAAGLRKQLADIIDRIEKLEKEN